MYKKPGSLTFSRTQLLFGNQETGDGIRMKNNAFDAYFKKLASDYQSEESLVNGRMIPSNHQCDTRKEP